MMSISSTHDFNVIHMRYQCYPHKMSIINTKYQCHPHKIKNVNHTSYQCDPHKYQCHPDKISTLFIHFINVIHTRYEFHSRKVSTECMSYPASIQYINPICIKYLSSRGNQDIDLVKTRSSDCESSGQKLRNQYCLSPGAWSSHQASPSLTI